MATFSEQPIVADAPEELRAVQRQIDAARERVEPPKSEPTVHGPRPTAAEDVLTRRSWAMVVDLALLVGSVTVLTWLIEPWIAQELLQRQRNMPSLWAGVSPVPSRLAQLAGFAFVVPIMLAAELSF